MMRTLFVAVMAALLFLGTGHQATVYVMATALAAWFVADEIRFRYARRQHRLATPRG